MPRPVNEQVVVITGASSGIGRETALYFGRQGASVVLAARNELALRNVAEEIEASGGSAHVVVTDVSQWEQVERLAREVVERSGWIDTWVNNAAVIAFGTVEDLTVHDIERVIQVDLMGQIYGMKAVLPYLIQQGEGTIINVSSALGKRAAPLLSAYSAAKHGIYGFTEALRLELARDHPGINVTIILPASIDTPFFAHGRSRLGVEPRPLPPVYHPREVAQAILSAAVQPQRDIYIGGAAKMLSSMQAFSPALTDRMMLAGDSAFRTQRTDQPTDGIDNLDEPVAGPGSSTGEWGDETIPVSPYTRYFETQNPNTKRLLTLALGAGGFLLLRRAMANGAQRGDSRYRQWSAPYPVPPLPASTPDAPLAARDEALWHAPDLPVDREMPPRISP